MIQKKKRNKFYDYSISRILKKENKITDQFEAMLASLDLEDIIALKLELAASSVKGKLFGFPIWNSAFYIVKESLIKFSLSSTTSQKEAANLLGISLSELRRNIKKFNIKTTKD
jgi:hypothetical protein